MTNSSNKIERAAARVIWLSATSVLIFCIWAALSSVEQIVRASGTLVTTSPPQIVQNLEGGIIHNLAVREGELIQKGQLLVQLDDTQVKIALQESIDRLSSLRVRRLRIEAELLERDDVTFPPELALAVPDFVASERTLLQARRMEFVRTVEASFAILEQTQLEKNIMNQLSDEGVVAPLDVEKARRRFHEAQLNFQEIETGYHRNLAEDLSKNTEEIKALQHKISIRQDQLDRTRMIAVNNGIVNRVFVEGRGAVVGPAERILEVVPTNGKYLLELRVENRDIANIEVGQYASIKFSAWDYSVYGIFQGQVSVVSANTFTDSTQEGPQTYYKVVLSISDTEDFLSRGIELRPGMQAVAELHTGNKTVLASLLRPLLKVKGAFREG